MALVPTGLITSRAQQEHGYRALAACVHPRRRTIFVVAGQVVDEVDLRNGSLVYRIISDLADPIVRLEVTTSSRGNEYLILLSASSEIRIWDIENRFHLAGVSLCTPVRSGRTRGGPSLPPLASWAVTNGHSRCLVLFSRAGSAHVEALHVQRQVDKPGAYTLLSTVEAKAATSKASCVTCISAHTSASLPLLALGTSDGIVSVFSCPWFSDAEEILAAGGGTPAASPSTPSVAPVKGADSSRSEEDEEGDLNGGKAPAPAASKQSTASKKQDVHAAHAYPRSTLLFAAAVSPDIVSVSGKLRKASVAAAIQAAIAAGQTPAQAAASVPTDSFYDMVSALCWHPTLPLLAGADGAGRIVVWRVGVEDGSHSVIASRDWCVPPTQDDLPRIVSTLTFHSVLPRLVSMAYCPQSPSITPVLSAWCTAHASLPPYPSPTSPALEAHMDAAAQDTAAFSLAHLTQAPALLSSPSAGSTSSSVVWLSGRAIPVHEVVTGSARVGSSEEEAGSAGEVDPSEQGVLLPDPSVLAPLVPYGGHGIQYGSPVVEVIHAPRGWFVTGGEGDAADTAQEESSAGNAESNAAEDLNSGSLADFAAKLAGSGKSSTLSAAEGSASTKQQLTAMGLKKRPDLPEIRMSIDAVLYVQTRATTAGDPPRHALQHSLHARPLGSAALGADDGASAVGSTSKSAGPEGSANTASKRLCWLPSYGPGGPLLPVSLQRSPSGRYIVAKFAYLSELQPSRVQDPHAAAAEQAALSTFKQAQSILHAANKKSKYKLTGSSLPADGIGSSVSRADSDGGRGDLGEGMTSILATGQPGTALAKVNGAVGSAQDNVLFVVIGPLADVDAVQFEGSAREGGRSKGKQGGIAFGDLAGLPMDVPVRALSSAVDVTLLSDDRLLTVRKPGHSVVGGAAGTEYMVTIEALDPDLEALAAQAEAEAAAKAARDKHNALDPLHVKEELDKVGAKIKDAFEGLGDKIKASHQRDMERMRALFGKKGEKAGEHGAHDKADGGVDAHRSGDSAGQGAERRLSDAAEASKGERRGSGSGSGAVPVGSSPDKAGSSVKNRRKHFATITFAVHDPIASVYPTPFWPPQASAGLAEDRASSHPPEFTEHAAAGNVLLYATRWRHPDDTGASRATDRIVLRYSNNAFGGYDESNPHGYALVDAYGPTAPPSLAKTWREEHTLEARPLGYVAPDHSTGRGRLRTDSHGSTDLPGLQRARSNTNVLTKQASFVSTGPHLPEHGGSAGHEEAWAEHELLSGRCPVTIRPALVLSSGEQVVRVTWQPAEAVWAEAGLHDSAENQPYVAEASKPSHDRQSSSKYVGAPPLAPKPAPSSGLAGGRRNSMVKKAARLTLPQAIASGAPMLAVLTTHRLLLLTPALQMLVALPALAPIGASVGVGLGHTSTAWGSAQGPAHTALACSHFGVWRGIFSTPAGHGQGYGTSAITASARLLNGGGLSVPEEGTDETEEEDDEQRAEDGPGTVVALGAGYVGVIDQRAALPGASQTTGQVARGQPAVAAAVARASAVALPIASPLFGLTAAGLAPPDSSATFISGVQSNTVASAAAAADRLISALPSARMSDTLAHDDVTDETVTTTQWRSPVVSHMWLGSTLLVTTASAELWYITPLGRARRAAAFDSWGRDITLVTACHDRMIYSVTHPGTGRVQIRARAFSPLEPLIAGVLDHSATRPKPLLGLLQSSAAASGQSAEAGVHPVVSALSHTLAVSAVVYMDGKGRGTTGRCATAELVSVSGATAAPVLALAALARDYCFVRDAVIRYSHGQSQGEGQSTGQTPVLAVKSGPMDSWSLTRVVASCLEERGLLDLAYYVAQGKLGGAEPVPAQQGEDADDTPAAWLPWLDRAKQRKGASVLPWHWRSSLALKRGPCDHAVWALLGEEPSLAAAVYSLTKGKAGSGAGLDALADYDPAAVRLPSPFSAMAARLRVLGRLLASACHLRASLLCFDVAGDHMGALAVLCLAGASAVHHVVAAKDSRPKTLDNEDAAPPPTLEGAMPCPDVESALGALLGPAKDRYPALALAAALHRRSMVDDEALLTERRKAYRSAQKRHSRTVKAGAAGGTAAVADDEDAQSMDDEYDLDTNDYDPSEDGALSSASLLDTLRSVGYAPGLERAPRGEALLPIDHSIGLSAASVAEQARKMLELHALTAAPALAQCPYLALQDETLSALLRVARDGSKRLGSTSGSAGLVPSATIDSKLTLSGGAIEPQPLPSLPSRHAPLSFDTLQRWMGSALPVSLRRGGAGPGAADAGEEDEGGGLFGLSLEGMLGMSGGQDKDLSPAECSRLSASGKRKLRALPRGTEDAVVGYWRFEKAEAEVAGEGMALKEWKKSGKAVPPAAQGGLWSLVNGASNEPLSPWHTAPVPDLSKQGMHGQVLDALLLLARAKGTAVAAKECSAALAQTVAKPSPPAPSSPWQPYVRLGWAPHDSPCDPGDAGKVKEPRALVAGVGTVLDPTSGKTAVMVKSAARVQLSKYLQDGGVCSDGPPGLEPALYSPALRMVNALYSWAVIFPVHRYSYCDLGMRPWDPVTACWTWEAWVKPGNPYPGSSSAGGSGAAARTAGDEEDEDTPSSRRAEEGSSLGVSLDRELVLVSRLERSSSTLLVQWQLSARADGSLCFTAFPGQQGGAATGGSVASAPAALPLGEWKHVAVVVEAVAAAKETSVRLKSAGGSAPLPDAAMAPASVKLYVDGGQVGEGSLPCGTPLPLVEDSDGSVSQDILCVAPDFVGRLSEVRLWAKRRTGTEMTDTRDFHLDLAETARKTRMAISIKPATLPSAAAATAAAALPAPAQDAAVPGSDSQPPPLSQASALAAPPTKRLGLAAPGGALGLPPVGAAGGRRKPAPGTRGGEGTDASPRDGASASAPRVHPPAAAPPAPTPAAQSKAPSSALEQSDDAFDTGFGSMPAPVAAPTTASAEPASSSSAREDSNDVGPPKVRLGLGTGGGGLGAPPPGVGGGKKAALLRARAAGAGSAPPS